MKRMRAKGRGNWVCTPKDFLRLGSRASIDQAFTRLTKKHTLRRIGCGLYDRPRMCNILNKQVPPDIDIALAAIVRRDNIRIMPNGIAAANRLGLTNAGSVRVSYWTDGLTRKIKVCGWTLYFKHVSPKVMSWLGRPSAQVAQAIYWLGPLDGLYPKVAVILNDTLSDAVKLDLIANCGALPPWSRPLIYSLMKPQEAIK